MDSAINGTPKISLVDSHAHLDMSDFNRDRAQVIERARSSRSTGYSALLTCVQRKA